MNEAKRVLDNASRPGGYRVPNLQTYPHQWLWDSCFHAVALVALGDIDEALSELEALFRAQTPDGFVPHMTHHEDPIAALHLWNRPMRSTITQPPMYGHAIAVVNRAVSARACEPDVDVVWVGRAKARVDVLVEKATKAVKWLLDHRQLGTGVITVVHPWETGCDNSPRFDGFLDGEWTRERWNAKKRELLECLYDSSYSDEGASVTSSEFAVGSAMFTALLSFNCAKFDSRVR